MSFFKLIAALFFIFLTLHCKAQNEIHFKNGRYYLGEKRITKKEVLYIMEEDAEASHLFQQGVEGSRTATLTLIAGALTVGGALWHLSTNQPVSIEDPPSSIFIGMAGLGIMALSIPIEIKAKNKHLSAIELYNENISPSSSSNYKFLLGSQNKFLITF